MEKGQVGLMKKRLIPFLVCLAGTLAMLSFACGSSGVSSAEFFTRLEAAFSDLGKSQAVADPELYNSEDGTEVFSCRIGSATLTTSAFLHTDVIEAVELTVPARKAANMEQEISAVFSAFYTDNSLEDRMDQAGSLLEDAQASQALELGSYTLTVDRSGDAVAYRFDLKD